MGLRDRSEEASDLLSDPRGYIASVVFGIIVGGIFGIVSTIAGSLLRIVTMARNTLVETGGTIASDIGTVGMTLIDVVEMPLDVAEGVAASAGPAAPIVGAVTFALVTATTAAIIWGIFRVIRFV